MRIALALTLSLISLHAVGAMRCDGPLSAVEKIICDPDTGLSALDDQLNESYKATLAAIPDKSALRDEQRKWLQADRGACKDWMCIQQSMRKRLVYLYNQRLTAQPPLENSLDDKGAQRACSEIGRLASNGVLGAYTVAADAAVKPSSGDTSVPFQFREGYSLPLRLGQPHVRYGLFNTGGSCIEFTIMPLQQVPTKPAPISETTGMSSDDNTNLTCDTGDEFEFVDRRFYLVNITDEGPRLIQWVAPDGTLTQICKLRPMSSVLTVVQATEPKICAAQAAGNLSLAVWKTATLSDAVINSEAAAPHAAGSPILADAEIADVDLTGDGSVEHVARLSWSYMGGNGGKSASFVVLAKDGMTVSNSPLAQRLAKVYLPPDPDIAFQGARAYVTGEIHDRSPYDGLVSVASDPPTQVCAFKSQTAYEIMQTFPLPRAPVP